jgi:hypothetical protein
VFDRRIDQKMLERNATIRRALQHYSNRLTTLREDDSIKHNNDILREDLLMNATNVACSLIPYDKS